MAMTERAFLIAVQARRLNLLANRPDLLYPDAATRAERAIDERLHPLDAILVAGASEADRLCAVGVQMLRSGNGSEAIRDLLGSLTEDDLLAVYHSLPPERQEFCRRDGAWAHALGRAPAGIGWNIDELESLRRETDKPDRLDRLPPEDRAEFNRYCEGLLRRALGMPHELSEQEEAAAEAGERLVDGLLVDDGPD